MRSVYAIETKLGTMHVMEQNGIVKAIYLPNSMPPPLEGSPQTNLAQELNEYLEGARREFNVPFVIEGPPFHKAIWQALLLVPYGHTVTYGQLAAMIGRASAARAVGQAMAQNPLPILVPCHRVVYGHGKKQSYAGGAEMKEHLLDMERRGRDENCAEA